MQKKKSGRPHGHYCKICGEYKANEKFSGRGHANHICKDCSKLSAADKAEAQTITRLENLHMGRLNDGEKKWLENHIHDRRPEVAALAREVYNLHFPHAERNVMKKRLLINMLTFELLNATVCNAYGDEFPVHITFTANRLSGVLTMTDFDADGVEQNVTLEKREMTMLLRGVIHTLEIFMWEEDYCLAPDDFSDVSCLDLLPEYWPDGWDNENSDEDEEQMDAEPEAKIWWRVRLEYADSPNQEIVSYRDCLYDRPDELFWTLMEYFEPESDEDFDGDDLIDE